MLADLEEFRPHIKLKPAVVREFVSKRAFDFDAYQWQAIEALLEGQSVLVAAPTGAGKTLVADFAIELALSTKSRAFYTTPIKALSNQKFRDLVELHGEGRVGLLTGDVSIRPEAPIVVMTTEVLRNMIYADMSSVSEVAWVILDEVHYLADRSRGAVWEEVIILLPPRVGVVCLSATVSNAEEFGSWLDSIRGPIVTIIDEKRPVPLHQVVHLPGRIIDLFDSDTGALSLKLIRYADGLRRKRRSNRGGRYIRRRPIKDRTEILELLQADGLLPAIYFIFSRAGCDAAMRQALRDNLDFTTSGEKRQIDIELEKTESLLEPADLAVLGWPTFSSALRRGIATHHAGMIPAFKELVEKLFIDGLIEVVFATETLAVGVNMPARSVVIEELDKFDGTSHVTLTPGEFTQLTGRAGRRGIDSEGFAVVVWQEGLEAGWVGSLASARTFPLKSRFRPDYNMSINLVKRMGLSQARQILSRSFAQFQVDSSSSSTPKMKANLVQQFDKVLAFLTQLEYLEVDGDDASINPSGLVLSHLHTEQDLLLAEAIRLGIFDGLPPAGIAAVASCVVYEPRRESDGSLGRLPPEPVSSAIISLARLDERLREEESRAGLSFTKPIEAGLSRVTWRWANGARLSQILETDEFTAGDFFRWMRQTIDVVRQIARASSGTVLEQNCLEAAKMIDRGIVSMAARL